MSTLIHRRFRPQSLACVRIESRAEGDAAPPKIAGYGAVYFDGTPETEYVLWDDSYGRAVERILPGAFLGVVQRPDDVRGLFNHDPSHILGRTAAGTMSLSVDAKGLRYEITPPKTAIADAVLEAIRRGDITGSSYNFSVPPDGVRWISTRDQSGRRIETREVLAVIVHDVGPVTFPAYSGASAEVRAASDDIAALRKQAEAAAGPTPQLIAECEARAREIEIIEAVE